MTRLQLTNTEPSLFDNTNFTGKGIGDIPPNIRMSIDNNPVANDVTKNTTNVKFHWSFVLTHMDNLMFKSTSYHTIEANKIISEIEDEYLIGAIKDSYEHLIKSVLKQQILTEYFKLIDFPASFEVLENQILQNCLEAVRNNHSEY